VRVRKPDEEMFALALDMAQLQARRAVFIDNTPMFTEIAQGPGIRSVLHTDYPSTRAKLSAFGLSSG
jgi:putative hydrolase of the HAD superfamily